MYRVQSNTDAIQYDDAAMETSSQLKFNLDTPYGRNVCSRDSAQAYEAYTHV